jgi:hypothetical protein
MLLVKVARSSRCSTVSMSSDGVALRMPHARAPELDCVQRW